MTAEAPSYEEFVERLDKALAAIGFLPSDPRRTAAYFEEKLPFEFCVWSEKTEQLLIGKQQWREL